MKNRKSKLSRREFIGRAAALAAAAAAPGLGGALPGCAGGPGARGRAEFPFPFPIIDVHVHASFGDEVPRRQAAKIGVDYSLAGLRREMVMNGVERALVIGMETAEGELSHGAANPMGWNNPEPQPAELAVIGGINPHRLDGAALERIGAALEAKRIRGLKIYLGYYHMPPDDERYRPVYDLAARHRAPVIFHTGDTYSANAKVRFAHPLPIDDIAVDYRGVTFVLAHLGNPWTMDAAELLYKNPNVYADLSGFLIGGEDYFADPANAEGFGHVVERVRRAVGWVENPRKFLYGSDWPIVPMRPYIALMRRAFDPEHHERVFRANALEVFGLG